MLLIPRVPIDIDAIQQMGLLAVKIAQMYAVRSDIIGVKKSRALTPLLQRNAPARPADFRARFEQVAGEELKSALLDLNYEPLAVASIGQVHRGQLRDGTEVILKITKSNFEKSFRRDVASLRTLLKVLILIYPRLQRVADPVGVLQAVESMTLREMDLRNELHGMETLKSLRDESEDLLPHLKKLKFPRAFSEYTGSDILVTEFINGPTLNDRITKEEMDYKSLLLLFRIHGYFLFNRGVFHGDLHPGNVIQDASGTFWFLDNSNVEMVPPALSTGVLNLLNRLAKGEFEKAALVLREQLSTNQISTVRFTKFRKEFLTLYENFSGKTVAEISLTEKMMATIRLAVDAGMIFPQGSFPVIKSLMYLDGMVSQVHPDAVLLDDVARFVDDFDQAP